MKYDKLITLEQPYSSIGEIYRKIRTNIEYACIDKEIKVINVTSSVSNETKTTTACNLAVMYANKFQKVLIIDTDLRQPSIHYLYGLKNKIGLSDMMVEYARNNYDINKINVAKYFQKINDESMTYDLNVLTAGSEIINPAEFLGSNTFKKLINNLKEVFDVVIIDSAPSSVIADGIIISSVCDATLFIIQYNKNTIESVKHTIEQLKNAGANIIGTLLTKTPARTKVFSRYYKEYGYAYGNRDGEKDE